MQPPPCVSPRVGRRDVLSVRPSCIHKSAEYHFALMHVGFAHRQLRSVTRRHRQARRAEKPLEDSGGTRVTLCKATVIISVISSNHLRGGLREEAFSPSQSETPFAQREALGFSNPLLRPHLFECCSGHLILDIASCSPPFLSPPTHKRLSTAEASCAPGQWACGQT